MSFFEKILSEILTVGGIAGVIAILITLTICARYVQYGFEPIPEVLSYALTTVIGFYFGTGVVKRANQASGAARDVRPRGR